MSTPASWSTCWKSFSTATVFLDLGTGGAVATVADEPAPVLDSLAKNPELDAVMSAAQTILDFKTQAVRDIEAGPIKSNIEPKLADLHELKRERSISRSSRRPTC